MCTNMNAFYMMQPILQEYEHLKIKLGDIITATNNFDDQNNYIGAGGFGKVYKGVVSYAKGRSMVAIKRQHRKSVQGIPEFLKEITSLSHYTHENLISLLGFCCEAKEMILVYELAPCGSLERHLNSPHLTWTQRVKICLDAAKGLRYLHDPREKHKRLIHCDIKSSNILLDDQWNAKIFDFGLSKMGSANEQQSLIITFASGTLGYIDPQYQMTHTLTKASDVYSFGVVLFEVFCGTSCCTYRNQRVEKNLVPTWIECYENKELNNIIFKNPNVHPMNQSVLERISDIAYRCLNLIRDDRPNMDEVVTELETALEIQGYSENKLISYYREIAKSAQPPVNNISNIELVKLMSKGLLLNGGKTWFSINKKGEHYEMISFKECLDSSPSKSESSTISSEFNSRFVVGPYPYKNPSGESNGDSRHMRYRRITNAVNRMFKVVRPEKVSNHSEDWILKTRVKSQFLSPGITYMVNLVFKLIDREYDGYIYLRYKLKGKTKTSISYNAIKREDGWYRAELCHLISDKRTVDLEILFEAYDDVLEVIYVDGIEFRPLEKVEYKVEKHSMSDLSESWEENLPSDYEDMMKWSKDKVQWTTKKEAYSIIRKGFLIDNGEKWFFLDKNGKKCYIVSAKESCLGSPSDGRRVYFLPESRFGEVYMCKGELLYIRIGINTELLSTETTYAVYLIYKLPRHQSRFEGPMIMNHMNHNALDFWDFYLVNPLTPGIRPKAGQNTHSQVSMLKTKGLPQKRDDGRMEVQIWNFENVASHNSYGGSRLENFKIEPPILGVTLSGLIIEGLEFRPK